MSGSPEHTVALVGNPNCGKTALFNALTGSRQKVANYAGVTVERKEGVATSSSGHVLRIVDLPGVYSLHPHTLDEQVTHDVLLGANPDEHPPEAIICVVDATNLHLNLKLVLELKKLGLPTVLAVNMMDLARACGVSVDLEVLQAELGVKAVSTVAVHGEGTRELVDAVLSLVEGVAASEAPRPRSTWSRPGPDELRAEHREVGRVLELALRDAGHARDRTQRIDRYVLHPLLGPALMA